MYHYVGQLMSILYFIVFKSVIFGYSVYLFPGAIVMFVLPDQQSTNSNINLQLT